MGFTTSSVFPELLQQFARRLAHVAFLQNITLLTINIQAIWQASLLKAVSKPISVTILEKPTK